MECAFEKHPIVKQSTGRWGGWKLEVMKPSRGNCIFLPTVKRSKVQKYFLRIVAIQDSKMFAVAHLCIGSLFIFSPAVLRQREQADPNPDCNRLR